MSIKGNPTLLTLLKAGCRVELPNGYALQGDPANKYIDTINCGGGDDGLHLLTRDGLKEALAAAEEDAKERNEA